MSVENHSQILIYHNFGRTEKSQSSYLLQFYLGVSEKDGRHTYGRIREGDREWNRVYARKSIQHIILQVNGSYKQSYARPTDIKKLSKLQSH